jgi:hypothetical protein
VLLRRGYVLSYDLVWVPEPPLSRRMLGLDGSVPRAVPSDLVAYALSRLVPGDLAQKAVLAAAVALAVAGTHRLAGRAAGLGRAGSAVAALCYAWSPYLAERLVLGHWALLLGVAALPWALDAAAAGHLAGTCAWTAVAAAGGANALLVCSLPVLTAVTVLATRRPATGRPPAANGPPATGRPRPWSWSWRRATGYALFCGVTALPWALPAVLRPGGLPSDPAGVDAFAPRADGPLGVAGSLMTLGGIWNAGVVPPQRQVLALAVVTLGAVLAALAAGIRPLLRAPAGPALTAGGVLGLVLAAAVTVPPGAALVRLVVLQVPGGGVLRDAQKFLAAWVLLVALCGGVTTARVAARLRRRAPAVGPAAARLLATALALLPVALLPGLAWGAAGRLRPVTFPPDWARARTALASDPVAGAVVVLPWGPYRQFSWNGYRVALDPVQRITDREVIMNDDLPLRDRVVHGEDPRARSVAALLPGDGGLTAPLARLGVRFVVLHAGATGAAGVAPRLAGARCVACGGDLEVYALDLPQPFRQQGAPPAAVLTGHLLALLAAAGATASAAAGALPGSLPGYRTRRRRQPQDD